MKKAVGKHIGLLKLKDIHIYYRARRWMCVLLLAGVGLSMASCITARRVDYLQDMTQGTQIELEDRIEARIAPYDELTIKVSASSISQEMASPFKAGEDYLVDVDGNIDFPVLGKVHVAGLTRLRLQDTLVRRLERDSLLDNPYVSVRFKSFKVFFLGRGTGQVINVTNERCTFLEALAMSNGLDNFTRRDRIGVMREVNGRMVMRYLDPRSSQVFSDPFYMLQQNDFIITEGMNVGVVRTEVTYWTSLITSTMSVVSVALTLLMYRQILVQKSN